VAFFLAPAVFFAVGFFLAATFAGGFFFSAAVFAGGFFFTAPLAAGFFSEPAMLLASVGGAPVSTGIAYQLIPKVSADKIPMYTPGFGRTSAQDGRVFEWVFNAPTNYWDGASIAVKYLLDEHGGCALYRAFVLDVETTSDR